MKRVLLGLGSNRPYKSYTSLELLSFARKELLSVLLECEFSSVYRTKAMYYENQQDFYNMVAAGYVNDDKNPFELLKTINQIEAKYGRDRKKEFRNGPRSLDIDIELFGDDVVCTQVLEIPHKRLCERAFVLIPSLEVLTKPADELIRKKFACYLDEIKKNTSVDDVQKIYSFTKAEAYGTEEQCCRNSNNGETCL